MRAWMTILVVLACAALAPAGENFSLSALSDGRTVDARLEWAPGGGLISTGPVVSWNKEQPDHIWGGGIVGFLNVTPDGQIPLRNLIPGVGDWLNLPETVPATIRLGGQLEIVNISHEPNIAGAPILEVSVGPVLFNFQWQIVEGGQIEDYMKTRPAFFFGVRVIEF